MQLGSGSPDCSCSSQARASPITAAFVAEGNCGEPLGGPVASAAGCSENQRPIRDKIPADLSHPAESGPLRVVATGPAAACHFHLAAGGEPAMTTYLCRASCQGERPLL